MSETLTRNELRSISRQIAELRQIMDVQDIVNRRTALEILDVTPETLSVYISTGKVRVVSRNAAGQAFFSRKNLLGL